MKLRKWGIAIMSLLLLAGCSRTETDKKIKTVPISEARQQLSSDMEELKRGDYPNLECDEFEPIFTDSNEWHTLRLTARGECESRGKKLAQIMRDNYEEVKRYFGKEPKKGDTEVYFMGNPEGYREVYEEDFLKRVEEGAYDGERYLSMIYDNDTTPEGEVDEKTIKNAPPHQYLMVDWDLSRKMLMTGTLKKNYPELSNMEIEDESNEICYYGNWNKEQLQDEYMLCDGNKVSVKEAMEMAEDYIEKHRYQECLLEKEVKKVYAKKLSRKKYMYYVSFVNKWNGIVFDVDGRLSNESMEEQEAENREVSYDIETVSFVGKDEVEDYTDYASKDIVEETGEAIRETITLKQALQQVSERIGKVSCYRIKSIELAYRQIIEVEDLIKDNEYFAYPVWEIEAVNQTDKKETRFYVDVKDCSIQADRFD